MLMKVMKIEGREVKKVRRGEERVTSRLISHPHASQFSKSPSSPYPSLASS